MKRRSSGYGPWLRRHYFRAALALSLLSVGCEPSQPVALADSLRQGFDIGALQVDTLIAREDLRFMLASNDSNIPTQILIAPNGSLVVNQTSEQHIRFYSAEGIQQEVVGASAAQNQFINILRVGWRADTLWVWDGTRAQLVFLTASGRFLDKEKLHIGFSFGEGLKIEVQPLALTADGYVVSANTLENFVTQNRTKPIPLYALSASQHIRRKLGEVQRISHSDVLGFTSQGALFVPFRTPDTFVADDHGTRVAWMTTTLDGPGSPFFRLVVLRANGDSVFARTYRFDREPIPPDVVGATLDSMTSTLTGEEKQSFSSRGRSLVPAIYALSGKLVLGQDSTIWVGNRRSATEQRWMLFGPTGVPIAELTLPAKYQVFAASSSHIWAVERSIAGGLDVVRLKIASRISRAT